MIIHDESADEYHAHQAVSASMLKDFLDLGPRGYFLRHVHGEAPRKRSKALDFGSAFDDLVFKPADFQDRYAFKTEDFNGRTKAGKAWVAEQEREGKVVLDAADLDLLKWMRQALDDNGVAAALLENGDHQVTVRRPWPKLPGLQARPDILGLEGCPESGFRPFDCNVKTTSSLSRWPREITRLGYHIQVGVTELCMLHEGVGNMAYALAVVEKDFPNRCQVFWMTEEYVEAGRKAAQRGLERLMEHYEAAEWPSVEMDEVTVECPQWLLEEAS